MRRSFFFLVFGIALCLCAMTSAAQAQATRTWVSGLGDDVNPCSRTAPCKTFAGAISKTAAGGEIDALDPGGFGALTISKAITIDGGGGQVASVLVGSGANGIVVNGGTTDRIILRNLRLNGINGTSSPGQSGIVFTSGSELTVENCYISNFTVYGIRFQPVISSKLNVVDTIIETTGADGMIISTTANSGGVNRASVRNTKIAASGNNGIEVGANSRVDVYASVTSNNGLIPFSTGDGIIANAANTGVDIADTLSANNAGSGIHTQNSAIIRVSNSVLAENGMLGVNTDTGMTFSGINNIVKGNGGGDGTFTGPIPLQ